MSLDAHGVWSEDERQIAWLLEYDTGSEALTPPGSKIVSRRRLHADDGPAGQVLIHRPSPVREQNLHHHRATVQPSPAAPGAETTPGPRPPLTRTLCICCGRTGNGRSTSATTIPAHPRPDQAAAGYPTSTARYPTRFPGAVGEGHPPNRRPRPCHLLAPNQPQPSRGTAGHTPVGYVSAVAGRCPWPGWVHPLRWRPSLEEPTSSTPGPSGTRVNDPHPAHPPSAGRRGPPPRRHPPIRTTAPSPPSPFSNHSTSLRSPRVRIRVAMPVLAQAPGHLCRPARGPPSRSRPPTPSTSRRHLSWVLPRRPASGDHNRDRAASAGPTHRSPRRVAGPRLHGSCGPSPGGSSRRHDAPPEYRQGRAL